MRRPAILLGALLVLPAAAHASRAPAVLASDAEDDNPKCARGECRPLRLVALDEDDPKLARGLGRPAPRPRIQAGYRFLQIADPYGGGLPMHLVEVTGFPVSGIFRLGLSLSGGGAQRHGGWMADVGLSVGVQYPHRVTPFLDVRFNVGALGAEIVDRRVVSYQYRPTIEGGIEVFVAGRFHLTAAVGWSHPVYGGVDANAIEAAIAAGLSPKLDVQPFHYDTVTTRVGVGF